MQLKDYYKILEVPAVATQQEIKKSFRRLAQQFHPDKNGGNHLAAARFREIQEAYEVLSDPDQRKEYNYRRWRLRSTGNAYAQSPLTPEAILEECRHLKAYVDSMSIFRINYDGVSQHIRHLITPESIGILHEYNDMATNRKIVQFILQSMHPLPLRYVAPIATLLQNLSGADPEMQATIHRHMREKKFSEKWERYKWIVVVAITCLLCWLIYAAAR